MKDLFEYYDEQPTNLKAITSEMEQNVDGFDYPTLEAFKQRCEAIGYTFDYDLSAEPFDLRMFNPNELTTKDLDYWRNNAEEDYMQTPISVLRYISELEQQVKNCLIADVVEPLPNDGVSITTEGHMNGNWQMKISQIKDQDLEKTEIGVLRLFGRVKHRLRQ